VDAASIAGMELVRPSTVHLESFRTALVARWSPSTERDESAELLAEVDADPTAFLAGLDDRDPAGRVVTLPDGSEVPRLPAFTRWMWDGEFAGSINARWRPGTVELPPHCLGHVGYSVVPWKQRRGYATRALALMLEEIRAEGLGLPYVEITTDLDNIGSRRVIEANGGELVEEFDKGPAYGGSRGLRFRVSLAA
jgi:predicted acetyltransferase